MNEKKIIKFPTPIASGMCGENLTWKLTDGKLIISGAGDMTDWSFRSAPWYSYRLSITNVIICDGVTSIGEYAFDGCSGLTDLTIPNSVTNIGNSAFSGCSSLTSVSIPNSVTNIGNSAFSGCSSLMSVSIPNSVTSIGEYAFGGCSGLTSIIIPNSVTSIGKYAFNGCTGITAVVWNAKKYSDFKFNSNTPFYHGIAHNYDLCDQITSFVFGDEVECIPAYLCSGMTKISSITIPNGVTSIGEHAFLGCSGLTSVTIGNSVTSIGKWAFENCSSLTSVTIGNSVTSIGEWAFKGCSSLTSVTIPNSVTSIRTFDFIQYSSLTSISVAEDNPNYSSIDGVLFDKQKTRLIQCPRGKQGAYIIPNSVTSIGEWAFGGCRGLTSVTIPNSVTSIGKSAFFYCSSLTSIEIPNSVTSIGDGAFSGCSGLTSPVYNAHAFAFLPTSYSGAYTIPEGIEAIAGYALRDCISLTSVTIPDSVTSIGEGAFEDCDDLIDIYVPKGQKERFAQMVGLEDIKHLIVEKTDVALNDRFTIRKLLYNNKVTCFYHFTSRKNIDSICKHGGLYSWHYLKAHQIDIPLQGGGELSQGLDRYKGVADYVHLSFCENHPMAYHLIQEGEDIVVLKISTDVALLDGTMFTDMNAVDSQCSCAAGLEGLQKVNIAATKEKYLSSDNPLFKYKQAEILVKTHIPLEYILNIDEFL